MSSPFAPRLGTNYCPTDEEAVEIETLLAEPSLRLKGLDDEIAELQRAIDKLAEERDSLGAYIAAHKALISPVRRLPLDIIEEIFVACLPTHRNCVMSASEAPVLLGRICSSWRTISLATPRLWAKLHIVQPALFHHTTLGWTLFEEKWVQRLETTKMWLARSGQCPLSISLESGPENDSLPDTLRRSHSRDFLQILVPFASRWQHIHLATPPSIVDSSLTHLSDADVPLLETMAFHHRPHHQPHYIGWGSLKMLSGARISSFSIPAQNFFPDKLLLQWHQLTALTMDGPPWNVRQSMTSETILVVLSRCPELRSCKLMVHDIGTFTKPSEVSIVELKYLHTLDLHSVSDAASTIAILLRRISLPDLRNFTFHGRTGTTSKSMAPFLTRSTRLESLDIDSNSFFETQPTCKSWQFAAHDATAHDPRSYPGIRRGGVFS
ncbi:hypothetical protein MVEN_00841000 [Mycena venus]|uniref:F-box domain-containing protein n=1 Tax=Mycena venus TaxID=2733690 RepID=A0A8H6YFB6_9AGAR|nr:hypothetical protein MVEN_00841000 [Mycena venus]